MPYINENLVALATANGYAGIGVIRISGYNLSPLVKELCHKDDVLIPRKAAYTEFYDAEGSVIEATAMLLNVTLLIVEDRPDLPEDDSNNGKQFLVNAAADSLSLIKLCRQQNGEFQHYQIVEHVELSQATINRLPEHLRPAPAFCP